MFLAQGFVQARRLSDGAILWSFVDDGLGPHPFLLIEDGVLYVGGLGELFALDARSGSLLWSTVVPEIRIHTLEDADDAEEAADAAQGLRTKGRSYGERRPGWSACVLFGTGAPPLPATAEALAPPESGEEDLPRYTVVPPPPPPPPPSPSPSQPAPGYRVYIYSSNTLWCLHVETGAVIWTHVFRLSEDPGDAFILADAATDRLFVAGDGNVHCMDAASGTRVWSHSKPRSPRIYLASWFLNLLMS
ncbi:hypothetical protein DFJ73DRAFT_945338 [Zopfochytrium polystomum]|nr:hypothetical protein DFJ73DRAFT_945338 [Zopfochytrium polystomum]